MDQRTALEKLAEVIPEAINKETHRLQLSSQQVLELYGQPPMLCNDIVAILPLLSEKEREELKEGIYERQWAFWNDPEQVKYYAEIHPHLPSTPEHFARLVANISPQDHDVVVDLGCGCGTLMKVLLATNQGLRIIGIDYAPEVLGMIPQLVPHLGDGRITLMNHDLRRGIPLSGRSQAKVISNWGIVNLLPDDLRVVLSEVHRVLKPGGKFVFSAIVRGEKMSFGDFWAKAPNKTLFLWEIVQKALKGILQAGWKFEKKFHLLFPVYSPEELVEMAEKANLSVVKQERTLAGKSVMIITQKGKFKGGRP